MPRHALLAAPAAAILLLAASAGPDGARPPEEFSKLLDQADRSFGKRDYLTAVAALQQGIQLANDALRAAILDSMPLPPDGFVELDAPAPHVESADPVSSALALRADRPVEMRYRKREGLGEVRILVAPNSPAVATTARAMALVDTDPNSELVEVGARLGILTRQRTGFTIRFVVADAHFVEVRGHGTDPEIVMKRVDTAFLDRVQRVLAP